jgi:hypothetical protein
MAYKRYKNAEGHVVPGVTTITGRFKDSGALIWWANAVGLGERDCDEQDPCRHCGRKKGKTHREAMQKAADVGNLAHALIEQKVKNVTPEWPEFEHLTDEQRNMANECLEDFNRWFDNSNVEILETEIGLVSEEHQFGGRPDAIARIGGKLAILDWKTSKGLYADFLAQVAGGYILLLEESGMFGDVEEVHVIRVSKESGSFNHHSWRRSHLQPAIDYFVTARKLYGQAKDLEKLLK